MLGTKFRPGGLRPFVDRPVSAFTDRVLELPDVFGPAGAGLDARALAHADHHAAIAVVETFLREREPRPDPALERVSAMVGRIASDRHVKQVEQLAAEFGMTVRSLQRLFREYVGVSPKWVIRRFRLHEAADRLAQGADVDLAALAQGLGYFDQAHFTSDFRRLVGKSPGRYREEARQAAG